MDPRGIADYLPNLARPRIPLAFRLATRVSQCLMPAITSIRKEKLD